MSKKIIQRTVLITEKNFPKLRREALVKSHYGNKKLYDTCEWTPFNKDFILFYSMLYGNSYARFLKEKFHWYKDDQRSGWVINYDEEVDCVIINPSGMGIPKCFSSPSSKAFVPKYSSSVLSTLEISTTY